MVGRLREHDFREAFCAKGRFRSFLERIPVSVITDPVAALRGAAAWVGRSGRGSPELPG
jgi:glucokinase